jgi:single-stranded DNA-binding protein
MKDINKVILLGRLGADPVQRRTKSGLAVTHFSVATSRRILREITPTSQSAQEGQANEEELPEESSDSSEGAESNGQEQTPQKLSAGAHSIQAASAHDEETQWHRIVAWGKQAETCNQYLHKGNAVYIEGSIRSRNYSDKNGVQKTTFEIHAETVSFLSSRLSDLRPPLKLAASE